MPSLRGLLSDIAPPSNTESTVIYVFEADYAENQSESSGASCTFTVPAGATSVTFELWGGGGAGHGGNCMWPIHNGMTGAYSIRTVPTLAGCQYTVCAAGSSRACCCQCFGASGCTSYVTGSSIPTTCAEGGSGGCGRCYSTTSVTCQNVCHTTSGGQGDFTAGRLSNALPAYGCQHRKGDYTNAAPFGTTSSDFASSFNCSLCRSGFERGIPSFPGGPGMHGTACSCRRCAGPGAPGLVKISFS